MDGGARVSPAEEDAGSLQTELPTEFFDEFFRAAAPEPTATLIEAVARYRRYVVRDG